MRFAAPCKVEGWQLKVESRKREVRGRKSEISEAAALFQRGVERDFKFVASATRFPGSGAGEVFAGGIVQFQLEDARNTCLSVFHVHIGPEHLAFFIEEEDDAVEFRSAEHHVEFARPFFDREFLIAQDEDDWLSLVFLIDEGRCESDRGRGVIEGE